MKLMNRYLRILVVRNLGFLILSFGMLWSYAYADSSDEGEVFSLQCNLVFDFAIGNQPNQQRRIKYFTIDLGSSRYCEFQTGDEQATEKCASIDAVSNEHIILERFDESERWTLGMELNRTNGSIAYLIKVPNTTQYWNGDCDRISTVPMAGRKF